jgi:hypothetical protein
MFGINSKEPAILMMREQIVLYYESLSSIDKNVANSMLQQVSNLDIDKIRVEMEVEKQSRAHIFSLNVWPTGKRTRGDDLY